MAKKIKLTRDKIKELEGFEDALDLINEGKEVEVALDNRRSDDNYDLYNFLDIENIRLKKFNNLVEDKFPNMKQHPQAENLINEAIERKFDLKRSLCESLKESNSAFNIEMAKIYNSVFKKS